MFDHYQKAAESSRELLHKSTAYKQHVRQKILLMQSVYIKRHSGISEERAKALRKLLDESLDKFYKATLLLEHIWALSHADRMKWEEILLQGGTEITCDKETEQLIQVYFESFLSAARSFLSFYMSYLSFFLSDGKIQARQGKSVTLSQFADNVKTLKKMGVPKIEAVEQYFLKEVMDIYREGGKAKTEHWGDLLKSLRDKITHFTLINFGRDGQEILAKRIRFNWPTIKRQTVDRFSQEIQNGMYFLLQDLSKELYDLPWESGPYRSDLWNDFDSDSSSKER